MISCRVAGGVLKVDWDAEKSNDAIDTDLINEMDLVGGYF